MSQTRLLREEEVRLLLPGARNFFGEGHLEGTLNETHFVAQMQTYIRTGVGFVIVAGEPPFDGALGAIVYPDFATGLKRGMEFFFYVNKEYRGLAGPRLMKAYEEEAKRRGAERVLLMHLAVPEASKYVRFYQRFGYRLIEQVFCKPLS